MNRLPSISHNSIISRNNTHNNILRHLFVLHNTIDSMIGINFILPEQTLVTDLRFILPKIQYLIWCFAPMFIANNEVIINNRVQLTDFRDESSSQYSRFDIFIIPSMFQALVQNMAFIYILTAPVIKQHFLIIMYTLVQQEQAI